MTREASVSVTAGSWAQPRPKKTVLVHIKRRRTPVVEAEVLKVIEKLSKKNLRRIFMAFSRTLRTLYCYTPLVLHNSVGCYQDCWHTDLVV